MNTDHEAIRTLIHLYAELIDAGDLDGVGRLFDDAVVDWGADETDGGAAVTRRLRETTRIHHDGTPRTAHVITNSIIDVEGDAATARSRYTVFQVPDGAALQPIICGRYHDTFERVAGEWRFTRRRYLVDLLGDLSSHLPPDLVAFLASGD